ncbi:MAG: DNA-binding protein [Epsilonproteobacteria bacterium]|nr:DNA-binding protein [Campylobacterota bacterium]
MSTKKMTVEEAANYFNISKEAIHNRIRRGTLQSSVENGIKYVLISSMQSPKTPKVKKSTSAVDDRFHSYLQEQNKELQQKIEKLEDETRKLRAEKEQLLIEERIRIEQIYKEKDIQLNNILNAISSKFLLEAKPLEPEEHTYDVEIAQEEIIEEQAPKQDLISLNKYLKKQKISKQKREKIIKKIKKSKKTDERFFIKKEKIYIDIATYDYDDLF